MTNLFKYIWHKLFARVVCQNCGTRFKPLWVGTTTQADGCAASTFKRCGNWFLLCHYGSKFDTNLYMFRLPATDLDPVCDNCIEWDLVHNHIYLKAQGILNEADLAVSIL